MVLDASALLALINAEPGAKLVAKALPEATISAVNLAEVVTKLIDIGILERDAWAEASDLERDPFKLKHIRRWRGNWRTRRE
jgi:ribonuclease VapC